MGTHLPPEEARTRRQLRELVSGKDFPEAETDRLVDSLPRYEVGLVVAPIAVAQRLQVELSKRNQPIGIATNGYVLFRLDGGRTS